jgi:3-oxoacyl-[acyl-carrier protein] reductase
MKVLITGGNGGIGTSIVSIFRDMGHDIDAPSRAELDLTKPVFLSNIQYDIIVNNAGINPLKSLEDISDTEVMRVNYLSPLEIVQQCLPHMKAQNFGRIVNIGSVWVELTKKNRSAYSASKAALHALSKSITAECAEYNILANTVSPGFIGTSLTYKNNNPEDLQKIIDTIPVKRLGTPEEIAQLVYFLTTNNTYITGQNIVIDGGFSCIR